MKQTFAYLLLCAALAACSNTDVPEKVEPVEGFELQAYLGKWYEIARLDHSFERGLEGVTAHYSLRDDGGVKVVNRGYNPEEGSWDEAVGKAYFVGDSDIAHLKVSFFGPFYGSYVVFELDPEYQYSLVSGPDLSYLWILARTPELDSKTLEELVGKARARGFATEELIFPEQPLP